MEQKADPPLPDNSNLKKPELTVYVFNCVEDEWSFISSVGDIKTKLELIVDCEDASDNYYLANATESDFVYVSPKAISAEFQAYAKELLNFKFGEVLVPKIRTHLLCDDLAKDTNAFVTILARAKEYRKVTLVSYCASPQLYSLADQFAKAGLVVQMPEAPDIDSAWTVNFFGSKSGIRQLAQQSRAAEPDFIMSNGLICVGKYDAAKIAANFYTKEKGVVIKTNKGSGGNGVFIFREGELPLNYRECEKKIIEYFNSDRYWDEFPIIIEELVNSNLSSLGSLPNVEFKIHKNGRIEMLYVCDCQVTPKGQFYGLDVNEEILNDRLQTRIEDTGYYIAEQYAAAGYRGHFDVDMMISKSGKVYVLESNTRHTGGTPDYKLLKKLIGKDFMTDAYMLSRSRRGFFKPNEYTFSSIKNTLSDVLYSTKTKEGAIIDSENSIPDGKLIYTLIAKNRKRAYDMEQKILTRLQAS